MCCGVKSMVLKLGLLSSLSLILCELLLATSKVISSSTISSAFSHKVVDWSFQSLFDRSIDRACPVAETSDVIVSLPVNTVYTIKPEPSIIERNSAKFDVKASKRFCIFFPYWYA